MRPSVTGTNTKSYTCDGVTLIMHVLPHVLHGIEDHNSVCPSVCLSGTRAL